MATIDKRGDYQWRARVRRNGKSETKTFESYEAAQRWALELEGKLVGDEYQDRRQARATTLAQACAWMAEHLDRRQADTKNKVSKLNYWQGSEFADWSLVSLRPADLIRWRRRVLDEDGADDGEVAGPEAEVGPQTVVHRLNVLAQIYQRWSLAHDQTLNCPVTKGVRPSLPGGRDRRLDPHHDEDGHDEEVRLLAAAAKSSRPWLQAAIVIALETCMRQAELAGLAWDRVRLDAAYPYADLLRTKNDRPRRVPLSARAVEAFASLRPDGTIAAIGKRPVLPVETGRGVAHAFRDAVSDAEFPNLRWHDLRHEAISRLFENTDLRDHEIMAISGHLRPEMLARYTHLRGDRLGARLPGGRLHRKSGES
ncbi:integrase/recombinase [Azospirillum sp. B510]|uniref:site-specific integrase n=2 Tax=Alphaproteobacteria TaxID=28211 RepID=UPI0001C4B9DD|nr:site-specific integrase [Azospirillum sp. B510]BAI70690.1 integrase/recombinase [Azospirillum sp. B510]